MSECPIFEHMLVVPHLRVQNANAVSSPLTHGFPAVTAFLGLMWALERKMAAAGFDLRFNAVGVVSHGFEEQITEGGFVKAFRLTRNPIEKDGGTAAIVEEGRIHLDLSLVFAVQSETLNAAALGDVETAERVVSTVRETITQMRIAGGTIVPSAAPARRQKPYVMHFTGNPEDRAKRFNQLRLKLLPGFTLVGRDDLLETRHQDLLAENAQSTKLDAWLSLSRINWRYEHPAEGGDARKGGWSHDRTDLGWIVPMPVGYASLSGPHAPGSVANARDDRIPFCFVESLYSVGQWLSPHRLQSPEQLLWYADNRPNDGLYRCRNDYRAAPIYDFD